MKLTLSTTLLVTKWAEARAGDKKFNDMVMAIKKDKGFTDDNKAFLTHTHALYHSDDYNDNPTADIFTKGFYKRLKWAEKEHQGKDEETIYNYAMLAFISDKCHTKITNLRSRPQFKNKKGVSIARPEGWDVRFGVSKSKGRKAIVWKDLTSLFDESDYTDD